MYSTLMLLQYILFSLSYPIFFHPNNELVSSTVMMTTAHLLIIVDCSYWKSFHRYVNRPLVVWDGASEKWILSDVMISQWLQYILFSLSYPIFFHPNNELVSSTATMTTAHLLIIVDCSYWNSFIGSATSMIPKSMYAVSSICKGRNKTRDDM